MSPYHADFIKKKSVRHYLARSVVIQHLREDETCKNWVARNYNPQHKQPGHWGYRESHRPCSASSVSCSNITGTCFSRWQANYYHLHRPL